MTKIRAKDRRERREEFNNSPPEAQATFKETDLRELGLTTPQIEAVECLRVMDPKARQKLARLLRERK